MAVSLLAVERSNAQQLVAAEYFIDADPGFGNATPITVGAAADSLATSFSVSTTGLGEGFHHLVVRTKDESGIWSLAAGRQFYFVESTSTSQIVAAEYFIGADPGVGNGTLLAVGAPADSVELNSLIDVSSLPLGEYTLSIRVKDTNGSWSLHETRSFTVCTEAGPLSDFSFVQDNQNVSFQNLSQNQLSSWWDFGDGQTSTLDNPFHTYGPGEHLTCLVAYNACLPSGDTTCQTISVKGLESIVPAIGGNQGAVTADLFGAGFNASATVRLTRDGENPIVPDTVYFVNPAQLKARFDLVGVTLGQWNVEVVVSPDTFLLAQAFEVVNTSPSGPPLSVVLTGPGTLRPGFTFVTTIICTNNTYNDAVAVPVWLSGLPPDSYIQLVNPEVPLDSVDWIQELEIPWGTIPVFTNDSAAQETYAGVIIPILPPMSSSTLQFAVRTGNTGPQGTEWVIQAAVDEPLINSDDLWDPTPPNSALDDCFTGVLNLGMDVLSEAIGFDALATCLGIEDPFFKETLKKAIRKGTGFTNQQSSNPLTRVISTNRKVYTPVKRVVKCAEVVFSVVVPEAAIIKGANSVLKLWKRSSQGLEIGATLAACQEAWRQTGVSDLRTFAWWASDPNAKYGPGGQSQGHYVSDDGAYAYTITFENDSTAGLPAQFITVIDSLDTEAFDLSSFTFTFATVGLNGIDAGAPTKSFVRDFYLRESMGVDARVVGSFDETTGVALWEFFTIDTLTGQATTDPLAGFLPPDTLSPLGQGYVGFMVNRNPSIQEGDTIRNHATIIFDYNDPIVTPVWQMVVDTTPPASHVLTLPPAVQSDSVLVEWEGNDALAGVYRYTVFVQKDGEGFVTWRTHTSETMGWFHGQLGSTYQFYSSATDSAGNVEEAPAGYDAATLFDESTGIHSVVSNTWSASIAPNPNDGAFALSVFSTRSMPAEVEILSSIGETILRKNLNLSTGLNSHQIRIDPAPGLYTVRLITSDWSHIARFVLH